MPSSYTDLKTSLASLKFSACLIVRAPSPVLATPDTVVPSLIALANAPTPLDTAIPGSIILNVEVIDTPF